MARCTFSSAKAVKRVSHIRDLVHVFSLFRVEKLLSTPAVLTGRLSKVVNNDLIIGNVC